MIMFYRSHARIDFNRFWLVGCFGFNGPLRQYFSLYLPKRGRKRRERIGESKNVQTTPSCTYCKRNWLLPNYDPNCRTPRHWKFTQDHRTARPPAILPDLWPFVIFSTFNFSCSFHCILIKSPSYCSHDQKRIILHEVMLDCLLPALWPFLNFSHFNNRNSCHRNSFILQGIFFKLSGYLCHHITWIIYKWGYNWIFCQSYAPL